jgi:hypothetical protein
MVASVKQGDGLALKAGAQRQPMIMTVAGFLE